MALIYGMSEEDFNDLPAHLQTALKTSFESGEATKTEIEALKKQVADAATAAATKDKVVVDDNPGPANGWKLEPHILMSYQTRRDQILSNLLMGDDKRTAVCIKKFRKDITDTLDKSHPQYYSNEQYIQNVINMIIGQHINEIVNEVRAGTGNDYFTETGSATGGEGGAKKKAEDILDADQLKAAKNFGFTPEQYLENLKSVGVL